MKKSKKSRILSLVLCMSMILSAFTLVSGDAAAQDTVTTEETTAEQPSDSIPVEETAAETRQTEPSSVRETESAVQEPDGIDITKMTTEEQYRYLVSLDSNEEKETEIRKLSQQQYEALKAYAAQRSESEDTVSSDADEMTLPDFRTVDFTKVAPFLEPVTGRSQSARKAKASAESTDPERVTSDGVVTEKTAVKNDDGTYRIRLESYVTGATTTTTVTEDIPTDIVLVLDQSGSMGDPFGYNYTAITRNKNNGSYNDRRSPMYYKDSNGDYYEVSVEHSWGSNSYAYFYTDSSGDRQTIGTSTGWNTDPGYTFYTRANSSTTKLEALKEAVTSFSSAVAEKAKGADGIAGTDDDVEHRIAIAGFASGETYSYENTELFIGGTQYNYAGNTISSQYSKAFQDMSTAAGTGNISASLNALAASGATKADLGMDMAKNILDSNPVAAGEKRNRVVIMFTDGSPTANNGFQLNVANDAISKAGEIKTAGATAYSVGIFSGADATSTGTKPGGDLGDKSASLPAACNWFMQNLSSNNGTPQTPSYYLSASSTAALSDIFQQISKQIETGGASVKLGSDTVVKDIVSDYFQLPEVMTTDDISISTVQFDGYETDGKTAKWKDETAASGISAEIQDKTVKVTGFDFSENYVGVDKTDGRETPRGRKLIIEFDVSVRDGFLGGNGVPTNGAASGIYTEKDGDETVVENFERPETDVPVSEISVKAGDMDIYLKGSISAADIRKNITASAGKISLDLSKENYGLEPWQNAFVDISVSAEDADGRDIFSEKYGGLEDLTSDSSYTVTGTVKAKSGAGETSDEAAGKISVFKPELTFRDSTVYYGEKSPADYSSNEAGVVWKHGDRADTDSGVVMTGKKPELTLSWDPDTDSDKYYRDGVISTKEDIPVKVTVSIEGDDITEHVTFHHENCSGECDFDKEKEQFLLHVKTCRLTVTKSGGADGEPYVMDIYRNGKFYTSMTITGNDSETVRELPAGKYTVKEDTRWAWRYEDPVPVISEGVELDRDQTSGSITVRNHDRYESFLNGYSAVAKNIFGDR